MEQLNLDEVEAYVNENIIGFHNHRLELISSMKLSKLIKKNPYLFRAKNMTKASQLVDDMMQAFLSSSEEQLFGQFLERLATYVAQKTTGGVKSSSEGIDLEFSDNGVRYVVSIKSGPNWGNAAQHKKQGQDFQKAINTIKQANQKMNVDAVLGICYGKTKTSRVGNWGYLKLVGQNFWTFISHNKDLYIKIVDPLGYKAKEHNDAFCQKASEVANKFTKEFVDLYCELSGAINWEKLIKANSENYDLSAHGLD